METWSSIPGETPIDPSGLKIQGISNRAELSVVEAHNIRKAVVKYLSAKPSRRIAPFDIPWCQRLHGEMFGEVWVWAGTIRNRNLNLGISFYAIRENLQALLVDLKSWKSHFDLVEQSARLHHRAVQIHPFENGNGRWARMLGNIWLRLNEHPAVDWPERTIGTESDIRSAYIAAIKKADDGEFEPLIDLHRRHLEQPDSPD
jgi:Fic-DOC domain mobile mystery protein B